jgi:hypothetical protein
MRTEIKRILTFGLHDGPVSRSQLFLTICLVAVTTSIVALFCANTDHPVICFFLFSYNAAIFVSIVRGRLKTVGEEVSGGCLFGLLVVFSILIPPLLLYLFFAKEKISQSPSIVGVKETVSSLEENGPNAPVPLPVLKKKEEPAGEITAGGSLPIDYSEQFRNFIESVEKPIAPESVDFQCFICNRRSKESPLHEGRTFRGDGLYGPRNERKDFANQNLRKAEMSRGVFDRSTFDRSDLSNANLKGSYFYKASFIGACLKGANLEGSDLTAADFQGAHLFGARLANARVGGANFAKADIAWADFSNAEMVHRNPEDELLIGKLPNFKGSNFQKARNLSYSEKLENSALEISHDGYLIPPERLNSEQLLRFVEIALQLEDWISNWCFFDRRVIEHAIRQNPLSWSSAPNQTFHYIITSWRRSKDSVWAERMSALLLTQVPVDVSGPLCVDGELLIAQEILQKMISEGIMKDANFLLLPMGVFAEYLNHGINALDELREMQSHLSS